MRGTTIVITLPAELAAALDAEARRRLMRRGQVLADLLRDLWPAWVKGQLERDLAEVVDVDIVEEPPTLQRDGHRDTARPGTLASISPSQLTAGPEDIRARRPSAGSTDGPP